MEEKSRPPLRKSVLRSVCLLGVFCSLHGGMSREISPEDSAFFETSIRPLLIEHCYECHDSGNGKLKGGLALNSPGSLKKGGDSGPVIVPGDPDKSLLIEAVRYHNRDLQMPPKSPLTETQISDLEKWVVLGAPDPRSEVDEPAGPVVGMSAEEGRRFWSFRLPEVAAVPAEGNPIDRFVAEKLKEAKIEAAGPATKEVWLRRVSLDLTGLPPTPSEITAFLADSSEGAYESVVDRLLASPAYGERWGRHWLDVARYADSNGLDENLAFANAWKYRDYVIQAFQEDMPFDRFLVEQLAGDLIDEPTRQTLTATGFLALGARVLAEADTEKLEMDVIDEQLDTMGKAFLGLTLGCARCHDHKFDPVSQADYYSLAAIFHNSKNFAETKTGAIHHWYEHDFADEAEKETFKKVDEKIAEAKKAASQFKSETEVRMRGEARELAVDYLAACLRFGPEATLDEVSVIAEPLGLHPHILYHCRRHLDIHRDSEVFSPWWGFRQGGDEAGMRAFYKDKFERAVVAEAEQKKEKPEVKELEDAELGPYHEMLYDKSGFLAVPAKPEHAFTEADLAEYNRLEEEARVLESNAPDYPAAMGIADADEIEETLPIHIRGNHLNLGDPVPRAVPAVFSDEVAFPEDSSGRLELARWMADAEHPLVPRVVVNRVWGWHFGEGLVRTTENFGALGDTPSHPELLDWLALRFVESGWSIKKLNRLIVLSDTYRRASRPVAKNIGEQDPENRLLSYFPLQRLDAESIRDSILFVSGRLDRESGGKTIPLRNRQMVFNHTSKDHTSYDSLRRTVYMPIVRNNLYDWLHLFDYPDPTMPTGHRQSTVIAPQALLILNSPLSIDSAAAFAARVRSEADSPSDQVALAWRLAYGREAEPAEVSAALAFVESEDDPHRGWSLLCQTLLASNEFLYVR